MSDRALVGSRAKATDVKRLLGFDEQEWAQLNVSAPDLYATANADEWSASH